MSAKHDGGSTSTSIMLTQMFKRTSERGNIYFSGRLGIAKVALLKTTRVGDNGEEIWNLLVSPPPPRIKKPV